MTAIATILNWATSGRRLLWVLTGVIAVTYAATTFARWPILSSDSRTYSGWADQLLSVHFNYASYLGGTSFVVPPAAYLGWVTLIALLKVGFGDQWPAAIVLVNYFLTIVAAVSVLDLLHRLAVGHAAMVVAALLFLAGFELFLWIPYVLGDSSFAAATVGVLYLLAVPGGGRAQTVAASCLTAAMIFYRPAALPIVALLIVALLIGRKRLFVPWAHSGWLALSVVIVAAAVIGWHAAVMQQPSRWPVSILSGWVQQLSSEYHMGIIVYGRPETYRAAPQTYGDFLLMDLDRIRYFFIFWAAGFSRLHVLLNILFFVPSYALGLLALSSVIWKRKALSPDVGRTVLLGISCVAFFAFYHSLQQLDFDWRYRLPCLPVFVVLAAIGSDRALAWFPRADHSGRMPADLAGALVQR